MRTALGFRAHSGWTALVAVAGTPDEKMDDPQILERRRIVIADPELPGSVQPYHAAAGLQFSQAEDLIRNAIDSSRELALEAISARIRALQALGHEVVGCGLVSGSGNPLPALDRILASHALIHTAEGEMFRDALVWASRECHLPVAVVREKSIESAWLRRITPLGKRIGPPWTLDQKYATFAALLALKQR
jgi:hypothetical protein